MRKKNCIINGRQVRMNILDAFTKTFLRHFRGIDYVDHLSLPKVRNASTDDPLPPNMMDININIYTRKISFYNDEDLLSLPHILQDLFPNENERFYFL